MSMTFLQRRVMYAATACIAAGALAYVVMRRRPAPFYGSNTNAAEWIDPPFIGPGASADDVLDVAVEYTFPASDPIAVEQAYLHRK